MKVGENPSVALTSICKPGGRVRYRITVVVIVKPRDAVQIQ